MEHLSQNESTISRHRPIELFGFRGIEPTSIRASGQISHTGGDLKNLSKVPSRVKRVLICEGDDASNSLIADCLASEHLELTFCVDSSQTRKMILNSLLSRRNYDVILFGFSENFESALNACREVKGYFKRSKTVLVAPQEILEYAPLIKDICFNEFLLKPLHRTDLISVFNRVLYEKVPNDRMISMPPLKESHADNAAQIKKPEIRNMKNYAESPGFDLGLIGYSVQMEKIVALARKVAQSQVNVLLTGESGTGKEMVARAIHQCSNRHRKPFVAINCAAIPRELLESELFGHSRGAFTGATSTRRGLFEEAHEGTILLDEIGDLPLSMQAKILRLLQTKQVKPLGQNHYKEVDVRVIAATHKNLKSLISQGEFREDLYYRLNVMPIHIPPLRDRREDILPLVEHFLARISETSQLPKKALSSGARDKLLRLPWTGNVRELSNVVERATVLAEGQTITSGDILYEERVEQTTLSIESFFKAGLTLKEVERTYIHYVLEQTENKKEAAIRILGIDRKTLYRKEKRYRSEESGNTSDGNFYLNMN